MFIKGEDDGFITRKFYKQYEDNIEPRKCSSISEITARDIMYRTVPIQHDIREHQMRMNGFMGGAPGL